MADPKHEKASEGLSGGLLTRLLWLAVLSVSSCQTAAPEGADLDPHRKVSYTLRLGPKTTHPTPLGTQTDILVDWYHADGSSSTVQGYRGWDFDGDGRFDMVEVLSEDGKVQSHVYDFNGDGLVDSTGSEQP